MVVLRTDPTGGARRGGGGLDRRGAFRARLRFTPQRDRHRHRQSGAPVPLRVHVLAARRPRPAHCRRAS
jgi:hypothetical protein